MNILKTKKNQFSLKSWDTRKDQKVSVSATQNYFKVQPKDAVFVSKKKKLFSDLLTITLLLPWGKK